VSQLLSKLVAGGLSAAVVLIWWPRFFPVDDVETWLARGVVWTLSFELLLHALAPLEAALWRSRGVRRLRSAGAAASTRLGARSPRARSGGRSALACTALAVPVVLLVTAPAPQADKPVRKAAVKRVTQVERVVHVERPAAKVAAAPATGLAGDPAARPEAPTAPLPASAPATRAAPVSTRRGAPVRRPDRSRADSRPNQAPSGSGPAAGPEQRIDTAEPAQPQQDSDGTGASGTPLRRFAG
jgi:hypothetical protein